MSERHTVDFARCSFNVVTDSDRRTITLQFDNEWSGLQSEPIARLIKAIRQRYGAGVLARLNRWRTGERHPFILPPRCLPHPDNPDVLCYEIGVRGEGGGTMDSALATLLEFLRQQPGYERTYGAPLDRDQVPTRVRKGSDRDASTSAHDALRNFMDLRHKRGVRR